VRWWRDVLSPLIAPADADYLLAFERLEAVRYAHWLRRGGVALINDYRLPPVSAAASTVRYPDEATEAAAFSLAAKRHLVPALALAEEAGNARTNNVVLVGSLAGCLPVDLDLWLGVISARVPASLAEVNIRAFQRGVRYAREGS
jgi:indolepyruvate ferredoxin oxidoreductase beta subunit